MLYKKCNHCKKIKPIAEFKKHRECKFGVEGTCKKCRREKDKIWYQLHKEEKAEYMKKYNISYNNRKKELEKKRLRLKPWFKTLHSIATRCNGKNQPYHKKGIKNYLTAKDLKYLWFRDKAYLMKKPSIDRINTYKHYTLDNCRYIELTENVCWNKGLKSRQKGGAYEWKTLRIYEGIRQVGKDVKSNEEESLRSMQKKSFLP